MMIDVAGVRALGAYKLKLNSPTERSVFAILRSFRKIARWSSRLDQAYFARVLSRMARSLGLMDMTGTRLRCMMKWSKRGCFVARMPRSRRLTPRREARWTSC